mmetsp:Transcript_50349/g.100127  ORF Transcript_50349/g.100127 Transcript_50349/m.100127 type:complete len:94 (-) Transcript_50349:250-531(-)
MSGGPAARVKCPANVASQSRRDTALPGETGWKSSERPTPGHTAMLNGGTPWAWRHRATRAALRQHSTNKSRQPIPTGNIVNSHENVPLAKVAA